MAKAKSKRRREDMATGGLPDLLRIPAGPVDLGSYDPGSTPGFAGDKLAGHEQLAALAAPMADLQERLYANGRTGRSGGCCSSCRGWTRRAKAAPCGTPSD